LGSRRIPLQNDVDFKQGMRAHIIGFDEFLQTVKFEKRNSTTVQAIENFAELSEFIQFCVNI